MRHAALLCVMLALLSIGSAYYFLSGPEQPAERAIEVQTPSRETKTETFTKLNLGRLLINTETAFETTITNPFSYSLEVRDIRLACGCLKVDVQPKVILPNSQAKVTGVINPQGMPGSLNKIIHVTFKKMPIEWQIVIEGEQFSRWLIEPREITLAPSFLDKTSATATVKITNQHTVAASLRLHSLPTQIRHQWQKEPAKLLPGESVLLHLSALPHVFVQEKIDVVFETNVPEEFQTKMILRIDPREKLRIHPPAIRFGVIDKWRLENRKVLVKMDGNALMYFHIEKIELPSFLHLVSNTSTSQEQILLDLECLPVGTRHDLLGEIMLHLKSPDETRTKVSIPVSGLIRDAVD